MKKINYFSQYIIGLTLSIFTCTVLANEIPLAEKNITDNSHTPSQYLPIAKINTDSAVEFVFIDKKSVKPHPYNKLIRAYTRVINYTPALSKNINGESRSYHSKVIQEFVNCDKKEHVEYLVDIYENPFGIGKSYHIDNLPKRWEATTNNEKERQNLIIVCSLPIND